MFGFTDLQVKVGRHKIAMVGGVVAGEAGGARVVPSILPYTEHINQKGLGDTHVHIWTLCQKCALHVNTEQTFALRVYHVFQSGMFSNYVHTNQRHARQHARVYLSEMYFTYSPIQFRNVLYMCTSKHFYTLQK